MKRLSFLIFIIVFSLIPVTAVSAQKVTPGSTCKVLNQKTVYQSKTYTCIKSGKKIVWNKGVAVKKPTSTPTSIPTREIPNPEKPPSVESTPFTIENFEFNSICDADPFVPEVWKVFQEAELKFNGCPPPYRYLEKELPLQTPDSPQTQLSDLLPITECKLMSTRSWTGGGPLGTLKQKATVIQVVPFYMNNKIPSKTPNEDWGIYLDFALTSLKLMADTDLKIEFRIPTNYIFVDGDIESFNLGATTDSANQTYSDNRWNLINAVIPEADKVIDFSDVDAVWFLASSDVSRSAFSHQIAHSRVLKTNEKIFTIYNSYFMGIPPSDFPKNGLQAREPFGFVHELMHIFNTLDDHRDGGGSWGNMSGARMDFLMWDKWSLSWIADSQVRCAPKNSTSVHWLKPSSIKGKSEKLTLIPLTARKAIAIESIRSNGFNLKLPKSMNGALIYTVDTALLDDRTSYEDGVVVICPSNRSCSSDQNSPNFSLAGATLKKSESVVVLGYKITVVESGDFGDVIKIEKID
jgi:hypothetical protein